MTDRTKMDRAQLFTPDGNLVATVDVTFVDGKWPAVVSFQGMFYALQNGRYVQAPQVTEATIVAEG